MVIDAPARTHAKELTDLVRHAETIVVPVLPSTIDMQATTNFLVRRSGDYRFTLVVTDADGSVQELEATVQGDGSYSVDVTSPLAEGAYTVEASVSADLAVHAALDMTCPPYMVPVRHEGALPDLQSKQINMYRVSGDGGGAAAVGAGVFF